MREKPNATTLSLEAVILFSNNKTAKWLCETPACESKELLQKARACAPEFRKLYHSRKKALFEERAKILQQKELALQQLQEKSLKEKEKTNCGYNGKWSVAEQTRCERRAGQATYKGREIESIESSIELQEKVLQQSQCDKEIF